MQLILAVGALSAFATSALAGPIRPNHKFWFPMKRANVSVGAIEGYTTPFFLGNASINSPLDCNNEDTYLGFRRFDLPFNIATCAEACNNQTAYALDTSTNVSSNLACHFFNAYEISINSTVFGQICALYSESYDATFATNTGYTDLDAVYTISNSYTSSNATDAGSCVPDVLPPPINNGTNSTIPLPLYPNATVPVVNGTIPVVNGTVPVFGNGSSPILPGNGTFPNGTIPLVPVPIFPVPTNNTNSTVPAPTAGPTVTVLPIPSTTPFIPPYGGSSPPPPAYGAPPPYGAPPAYGAPPVYGGPVYGAPPSYSPPSYGPSSYFGDIFGKVRKLFV